MRLFTACWSRLGAAFLLLALPLLGQAQTPVTIANFNFNSAASYPAAPTSAATDVTARVTSTETFSTTNNGGTASGSSAFTSNTSAGTALVMTNSAGTNTRYFQLELSGTGLSSYSRFKVYAQHYRSNAGATTVTLAYSVNGGSFTNLSSSTLTVPNGAYAEKVFDVSGIAALDNPTTLTFRLLASGASSTGYLRLDNLQVQGVGGPALTDVLVPQYAIGHGAGASSFSNRLPVAFRATLNGLSSGATYRYFTQAIVSTDAATTTNAKGNSIFATTAGSFVRTTSPGLSSVGTYGSFTATGTSYTGWFALETTASDVFDAGTIIKPVVVLNNGAGGTTAVAVLPTTATMKVLQFGNAITAANAHATAGYGSSAATASNFVLTYDNTAGTGQPLYATFVESDGTVNTVANYYAPFYATNVEGQAGRYGFVTPNNNANGIRRLEQRALGDGSIVCANTDADGTWPGGADTSNPTGSIATPLVFANTDAPLAALGTATLGTSSGGAGSTVTVTGSNFVRGGTSISINGLGVAPASITVASSTSLTFVVPASATSGPVLVSTTSSCSTIQNAGNFTITTPTITVADGPLTAFNTLAGQASTTQTLTVSGSNLTAGLLLTPPAGYELSLDGGATYSTTVQTLNPSSGTVTATPVRLRITGLTPTASLGTTLQIRSTGAANQDQTTSGTVVAEPTTAPTVTAGTPTATQVTLTLSGGDGTHYLVVVRPTTAAAVAPTDATTYNASPSYGTTGPTTTTGATNYVVVAGAITTTVVVTDLEPATSYAADIYAYNVGTVAGFENYLPTAGTSGPFTTQAVPQSPAGVLLLEEDFDYSASTMLTTSANPNATTGWAGQSSGIGTNPIATAAGNLQQQKTGFPQGPEASTSGQVSLGTSGQDIYKAFAPQPIGTTTLYVAAVVTITAAQSGGDYFLHLNNSIVPGAFRGRVHARAVTGGVAFGLGTSSETATYNTTTIFGLNTPYLLVLKYENSINTSNNDQASLFVLDNSRLTPTQEPGTALITLNVSSLDDQANLNSVSLRQGTGGSAPTVSLDGLRVATGWGTAVGRPVFTSAAAELAAGSYYDVAVNNADEVSTSGAVNLENVLTLTNGLLTTSAANPLTLAPTVTINGGSDASHVNGPLRRSTAGPVPGGLLFPVGQGGAYRPITLNSTSQDNAVVYTAGQRTGNPGQTVDASSGLQRVSTVRSYVVAATPAPTNFSGTITLSFGPDDLVNNPADPSFVVARRSDASSPWLNIGRSSNTGTGTGSGGAPVSGTLTSGTFTSFSEFALASTSATLATNPLPVELTRFTAVRTTTGVRLSWNTASEKNSAHFEVQRMTRNDAGFVTVATTAAQGNSAAPTAYTAFDAQAPASVLYYRLRQVDKDGKTQFLPVVTVAGTAAEQRLQAYPNPITDLLTISNYPAGQNAALCDLSGRVVLQAVLGAERQLHLSSVPAGTYLLYVDGQVLRVTKQ